MVSILRKELKIDSKYYKYILSSLNIPSQESRLIGGCVRDSLLNKFNSDIDIATTLQPDQVMQILADQKIKVAPTGIKFGTVSAFYRSERFEITTLRKDLNCNGRHTDVTFTTDFEEDAKRRDFTINALSYCPFKKQIYDYTNGVKDLKAARVIFIGNPLERVKEDFLRILRFFRFSNLYAKELDQDGLRVCIALKNNLKSLSKERIKWEMDKLLISSNAARILPSMLDSGILQIILPITAFDSDVFNTAVKFAKENDIELKLFTKYALMFYQTKELSIKELVNLKFSKQESAKIFNIILFLNELNNLEWNFLLKKKWLEEEEYLQYILAAVSYIKLTQVQAKDFIKKYNNIKKPNFPLTGNDLLKLKIKEEEIGATLKFLRKLWIESNFQLIKSQLLELLEKDK